MKSILTDNLMECYICGGLASEFHHCIHGTANRKLSDKHGLVIPVCRRCHTHIHEGEPSLDIFVKRQAQRVFEESHTRAEFMRIFGKSFI